MPTDGVKDDVRIVQDRFVPKPDHYETASTKVGVPRSIAILVQPMDAAVHFDD